MGSSFSRKQEISIQGKLIQENLKRVLFFSAFLVILIPVALLVISFSGYPDAFKTPVITLYLSFEGISIAFLGVSYFAIRVRDESVALLTYRIFWAFFLLFSMFIVYMDHLVKIGGTYYYVMLAALCLVPLFSFLEMMYYMVVQAVFILFISIKFSIAVKAGMDLLLVNLILIGFSRYIYTIFRDRYRLKDKLKHMKSGNDNDPLTGLLNRRGLEKEIETAIDQCIRQNRLLTILMIDVDYLKQYNDDFGFSQGDHCLKQLAASIKRVSLRNTHVLSRIEGGKFLCLLHGKDDKEPLLLAEKIRSTVERMHIKNGRNAQNPFITVSIGIASSPARSLHSFSDLYDEAEDALTDAKKHGKNLIVFDEQVYGKTEKRAT